MLDIPLLKSFVTVVESGGFTRAAERLHLTQSAISLHIKRLEEQAGRRLLERTNRAVQPTAAGETLLGYARRILALHDEAEARMGAPELTGTVRFAAPDYFATRHLPAVLSRFNRSHPGVGLEISTGLSLDLWERLVAGELDLAVGAQMDEIPRGRMLWREPRVWVASEDFVLKADEPVPLAVYPARCTSRRAGVMALDEVGRSWRIVYTGTSVSGLQAAVLSGLAVAVMPLSSVVVPGLRALDPSEGVPPLPDFEFALFTQAGAPPPAAQRLADVLIEFFSRPAALPGEAPWRTVPVPAGALPVQAGA